MRRARPRTLTGSVGASDVTRDEILRVLSEIHANIAGARHDGACACIDTQHDLEQIIDNANAAQPLGAYDCRGRSVHEGASLSGPLDIQRPPAYTGGLRC